jgi:hypothetical protein
LNVCFQFHIKPSDEVLTHTPAMTYYESATLQTRTESARQGHQ